LTLQFSDGKMKPMDRKPQQQTLSIRISDSLREFLERSKKVIAAGRTDFVSTSDVAKILLESAKDDGLDSRLEVAELGQAPTEALVAIRRKWEAGQPRTRAEWIFMAQYIQTACEELTGNPLAPGSESYVALLQSLLAVRGLRTDRGAGLDRYYLGNLVDGGMWNDRKLDGDVLPDEVAKLIEEIRTSGNGKKAAGVGRCFYVAVRDEEFQEVVALNNLLTPHMRVLFRMAARGHWIQEQRPVRLLRDGALLLPFVPKIKQGDMWLRAQAGPTDLDIAVGINSADLIYTLVGYAQIREFHAMLNSLTPERRWDGVDFHGFAESEGRFEFRRKQDGVMLAFTEENWTKLRFLFATAMAEPKLQSTFAELSLIYGEL
jgi:hypothetical protein